ncbi:DMT family transporter [Marinobacter fonticola]|uniref:DMT family transporter n=1 Tax=Marinobacter fonticola TaxID=2603215 RepID=UPI0011E83D24|nr:DMT family transporter [Marinobacter fonticola]
MHVPAAYLIVVLVWSTTPLGIVWSGETIHPIMAAWSRMAIAAVLGWLLLRALRIPLSWRGPHLRAYGYALLGVYGALSLSYVAAQTVPSGLISVLFGLSPLLSALLAQWLLNEPPLPVYRWIACVVALAGLGAIFLDDVAIGRDIVPGVLLILVAVALFSYSAVMVKKTASPAHPLAQTVGTLLLSQPFFAVTWLVLDGSVPSVDWSSASPWAIVYLALFGSLLGFVSYYHVLRHLSASTVALVTLITPVFALYLGQWLNGEIISAALALGSGLILAGLALFFFGHRIFLRPARRPRGVTGP